MIICPSEKVEEKRLARVLEVANDHWCGKAVFEYRAGVWKCVSASWEVQWMLREPVGSIKNQLLRLGCKWRWI